MAGPASSQPAMTSSINHGACGGRTNTVYPCTSLLLTRPSSATSVNKTATTHLPNIGPTETLSASAMASSGPPTLRFSDQVDVHTFEVASPRRRREGAAAETMAKTVTSFKGEQVTEGMLKDAARLFSENYGTWGSRGAGKPGLYVFLHLASAQLTFDHREPRQNERRPPAGTMSP